MAVTDPVDARLLAALADAGKVAVHELAAAVNMDPREVAYRLVGLSAHGLPLLVGVESDPDGLRSALAAAPNPASVPSQAPAPQSGQAPASAHGTPSGPHPVQGTPSGQYPVHGTPSGAYPTHGGPSGAHSVPGPPSAPQPVHGTPSGAYPAQGGLSGPQPAHGGPSGPHSVHGTPSGAYPAQSTPGRAPPAHGGPGGPQPGHGTPGGQYSVHGAPSGAYPAHGTPSGQYPMGTPRHPAPPRHQNTTPAPPSGPGPTARPQAYSAPAHPAPANHPAAGFSPQAPAPPPDSSQHAWLDPAISTWGPPQSAQWARGDQSTAGAHGASSEVAVTERTGRIGDVLRTRGLEGEDLTVQLLEVQDPADYLFAAAGYRLDDTEHAVVVHTEITNRGVTPFASLPDNYLELLTAEGTPVGKAPVSLTSRPPHKIGVAPGETTGGHTVYVVGENTRITSIRWSPRPEPDERSLTWTIDD